MFRLLTKILSAEWYTASGEAIIMVFKVSPGALVAANASGELANKVHAALGKRIKKAFGKTFRAEPVEIDVDSGALTVTLSTTNARYRDEEFKGKAAQFLEECRRDLGKLLAPGPNDEVRVQGTWSWGSGVRPEDSLPTGATPTDLDDAQAKLKRELRVASGMRTAFLFGGIGLLLGGLAYGWAIGDWFLAAAFGPYAIGALVAMFAMRERTRELASQIQEFENKRELDSLAGAETEKRAQKLLQVNSFELKRYYDQTLRQGGFIFWVGVLCIVLGFAVVGVAFYLLGRIPDSKESEQLLTVVLGAIGGVLANFIGLVYLRMFSETVKSVSGFHERLVETHRLYFANFLSAKVIQDQSLQNKTLAGMAVALAESDEAKDSQVPVGENGAAKKTGKTG